LPFGFWLDCERLTAALLVSSAGGWAQTFVVKLRSSIADMTPNVVSFREKPYVMTLLLRRGCVGPDENKTDLCPSVTPISTLEVMLAAINRLAYPGHPNEVQLLWYKSLIC
jgi:hypothetical protein